MTFPHPECTCAEPEKWRVWPNGDRLRHRCNAAR